MWGQEIRKRRSRKQGIYTLTKSQRPFLRFFMPIVDFRQGQRENINMRVSESAIGGRLLWLAKIQLPNYLGKIYLYLLFIPGLRGGMKKKLLRRANE